MRKNLNKFYAMLIFIFLLSPSLYGYISVTQTDKRTDYKGKQIARAVENKLKELGFPNTFRVYGDEWIAGNLCYHLKSKPKCLISSGDIMLFANNSQGIYRSLTLKQLLQNLQK